ncbi:RHS repeat-associated core domain-containing protein [Pseudomonas sichuanensis]|uniref:RHS repeat-associated core domain-containing protein n=1 Tax=Pseudomonas sichuanensis TaxID=2213015 RepID=UPI00215FC282|nr:RHS repeat-associated core domain-containing protein [Pseudomonas sichuanensis]UVK83454.1 RHS repeat-associated core domain-containing protein [Pseudomonas sichuanensis]
MPTYLLACDRQRSPIGATELPGRSFTAYGALPSPPGLKTGFCGQLRESRVDGYLLGNGHRHYNPTLMRFYQPDALSPFAEGGIHAYLYCSGDPVNRHDPSAGSSVLISQIIQRSGTIALHTASPLALMLGPEPKGALAVNASRVALLGSATSVAAAGMGLAGVGAANYVANAGTALLAAGAGTRIAKAVWDNWEGLWRYMKRSVTTNARAILGMRPADEAARPAAVQVMVEMSNPTFTTVDERVQPGQSNQSIRQA